MDKLDKLEESGDAKDLDKAVKLMSEAPSNVADPVLSRWGSVMKSVEVVLDNYAIIYVFARSLKHREAKNSKSSNKSYLFTICCALLSLMNTKEIPDPNKDNMTWEEFVESFDIADAEALNSSDAVEIGDSPVFYTALSFLHGFNKSFYEGTMIYLTTYSSSI